VSIWPTGYVIEYREAKIELRGDDCAYVLTVSRDGPGVWRCNLSAASGAVRNLRVAYGRVLAPEHDTAARLAAAILARGYKPGTAEHGLFGALATADAMPAGQHSPREAARVSSALRAVKAGDAAITEIGESDL